MLAKNLAANFIGRIWSILSIYLFVPVYVKLLGIDGYGLISLFTTLSSFLLLADVGLSLGVNRELAKADNTKAFKTELVKSIEIVFLIIGIIISSSIFLTSDLIAEFWIKSERINESDISLSIILMGLAASTQLISSIYFSGLVGLEKQVFANLIQFIWSLIRSLGAVLLMLLVDASVETFLLTQIFANVVYIFFGRYFLLSTLGAIDYSLRFKLGNVKHIFRFSSGLFIITVISFVNLQSDKFFISLYLKIEDLGLYNIAYMIAQVPLVLSTPVSTAIFPRYARVISENNKLRIDRIYYLSFMLIFIVVIPLSVGVSFFSENLISVWTDAEIAEQTSGFASILVCGSMFLAFQVPSFNLALAHGKTSINIRIGLFLALVTAASNLIFVQFFGLIGAVWVWFATNLIVTPLFVWVVNKSFNYKGNRKIIESMFVMLVISCVVFGGLSIAMRGCPFNLIHLVLYVAGGGASIFLFIRFYLKVSIRQFIKDLSLA